MVQSGAEQACGTTLRNLLLAAGLLLILFPMYLVLINSFKTLNEASQNFFALPQVFSLDNVTALLSSQNYFPTWATARWCRSRPSASWRCLCRW
jgi:raffinose/stachyose/melibiose transport system permease protein